MSGHAAIEFVLAAAISRSTGAVSPSAEQLQRVSKQIQTADESEIEHTFTHNNTDKNDNTPEQIKGINTTSPDWKISRVKTQLVADESSIAHGRDIVERLVGRTVASSNLELDANSETKLIAAAAEELETVATSVYRSLSCNNDLRSALATELDFNIMSELGRLCAEFSQSSTQQPCTVYLFPEERKHISKAIVSDNPVEFVDRPEVPEQPDPGWQLVLGPQGSGKTRVVGEWIDRLPDDTIQYVVVPETPLLDPTDVGSLLSENISGNVLLVWEDIQDVVELCGQRAIEVVIQEFDEFVTSNGGELYVLCDADESHADDIAEAIESGLGGSKPGRVTQIALSHLGRETLQTLAVKTADRYGITLTDKAATAIAEKAGKVDAAPLLIHTIIITAYDELASSDVEELAASPTEIWETTYENLQEFSQSEWHVLAAMKLLSELGLPLYSKLVRHVCVEIFDESQQTCEDAVRRLSDRRQWVSLTGESICDTETTYDIHELPLNAIDTSSDTYTERLIDAVDSAIPQSVPQRLQARAYFASACSLAEMGILPESRRQFETAIDLEFSLAQAHYYYARFLYNELSNFDQAENQFETAHSMCTAFPAVEELSIHQSEESETTSGVDSLGSVTSESDVPEAAKNHYNKAIQLYDKNPSSAAIQFEQAIACDPEFVAAHNDYATLLRRLGRPEDAADEYEQVLRIRPEYAQAHFNYAILLTKEFTEYERAEKHYRRALSIDPEMVDAHNNYAQLLSNHLGRPADAATHYERAIEIEPDFKLAHYNYAILLRETKPKEADYYFRKALELDPEFAEAYSAYGWYLYDKHDEYDSAVKNLEQSLQLHLDHDQTQPALRSLKSLVDISQEQSEQTAVVEYTDRALELLAHSEKSMLATRTWFATQRADAESDTLTVLQLYKTALDNVLLENEQKAMNLLQKVWQRRSPSKKNVDETRHITHGGLAYAALIVIVDVDLESPKKILHELQFEQLEYPANILLHAVLQDETIVSADKVLQSLDELRYEQDSLRNTETRAFAILIEKLTFLHEEQ